MLFCGGRRNGPSVTVVFFVLVALVLMVRHVKFLVDHNRKVQRFRLYASFLQEVSQSMSDLETNSNKSHETIRKLAMAMDRRRPSSSDMMKEVNPDAPWPRLKDPKASNDADKRRSKPWSKIEDIIDYHTSSGIGLVHTIPPEHYTETQQPELCREDLPEDLEVTSATYLTTSKKDFDHKFVDPDPMKRAEKPSFRNFLFMQNAQEKFNTAELRYQPFQSEMKDKYKTFYEPKASGEIRNFYDQVHCKIKNRTKGDQPKIKLEDDGYGKYLDIYNSQSHLDYTHKHPLKVHNMNYMPPYRPPLYPTNPQKRPAEDLFINRPLPKPGTQSISETKASFTRKDPIVSEQTVWPVVQFKQTKGDVIATPGMYHTEYSHIGSDWLVEGLIGQSAPDS